MIKKYVRGPSLAERCLLAVAERKTDGSDATFRDVQGLWVMWAFRAAWTTQISAIWSRKKKFGVIIGGTARLVDFLECYLWYRQAVKILIAEF